MPRYVSPYGPKLRPQFNFGGWPLKSLRNLGITTGVFGAVAGGTVIYLLEGVPRVQNDLLSRLPVIGGYWTGREKPASDNPF